MSGLTSESHPLFINELLVPGCNGIIGITFCPGKKDGISRSGVWDRDLDKDLIAICEWGATCLVTLMEEHEFELLGVGELPSKVQDSGLAWYHLPIRDVSIPDFRFNGLWPEIGRVLTGILSGGGRVVVHCRGGLGRSGLVAALLLVEAGLGSRLAVEVVREARPGAIETIQQEAYVRGYRPIFQVPRQTGGYVRLQS